MIDLIYALVFLLLGYGAAYLVFAPDIKYLREQNRDLLGDMHHRHGFKPESRLRTEQAATNNAAPNVEPKPPREKFADGFPDLLEAQARKIAEMERSHLAKL